MPWPGNYRQTDLMSMITTLFFSSTEYIPHSDGSNCHCYPGPLFRLGKLIHLVLRSEYTETARISMTADALHPCVARPPAAL